MSFAFFGCDTPSNSSTSLSVVKDSSATNEFPAADTSGNTDTEAERNNNAGKLKGEVDDDGSVLEIENLNDFDSLMRVPLITTRKKILKNGMTLLEQRWNSLHSLKSMV